RRYLIMLLLQSMAPSGYSRNPQAPKLWMQYISSRVPAKPINGPTDVMPGRKLKAAIIIPITIKAPYVCLAPMAVFFCSKSTHETPFKHIVLHQYTTQTLKDKSCGQIEKTEIYESQVINDTFF